MKKLISIGVLACIAAIAIYLGVDRKPKPVPVPPAPPEEQTVTFLEGWGVSDYADYLQKQGLVPADQFLKLAAALPDTKYPTLQLRPDRKKIEGYLFPDTYRIYKPTASSTPAETADEILGKLASTFEKKFGALLAKPRPQNLTPHQVLTLASIVERETGRGVRTDAGRAELQAEREVVAAIFLRRLKIGMALESDATVNYVTGKSDPAVSLKDTEVNSPYNTYKNAGLPPGPICNPSLSSVQAVMDATDTPYLYFLHAQPSGEVVYSKTFEEHVRNKQKYLR